jgi:vanillate O-demethylase ferredoxin subunit
MQLTVDHADLEPDVREEEPAMDSAFEVRLHRSGRTIAIPASETVLERLLEEGVDVVYSCMAGNCGTCETRVLDGIPDHRDSFLGDEERGSNNVMMICCSRSKTPVLVLDL